MGFVLRHWNDLTDFLARSAKKVYGVEIIPAAIEDARGNAARNGLDNTEFFVGKAEEVLPEWYEKRDSKEERHADVIVVDPPRKGCDSVLLDTITAMHPDRIVYVSCDSATLARDLKYLTEKVCNEGKESEYRYQVEKVQPVDMFPVECTCGDGCLAFQGEVDSKKIRVEFSFGRYGYVRISGWGNLSADQGVCVGAYRVKGVQPLYLTD